MELVSALKQFFEEGFKEKKLPLALVAMKNEHPVGTVSLKRYEVETKPLFENWLGSLYVQSSFRSIGIGSNLIKAAEAQAKRLGIKTLYLYTRHQSIATYYAKCGWRRIEQHLYNGRKAIFMEKRVNRFG
jgi:predicted N-acetyltransferase YhbS